MIENFLPWIEQGFLWYFSSINLLYTILLIIASFKIVARIKEIKEEDTTSVLSSNSLPTILFVIPMYNESKNAIGNIFNILHLSYRYKQIIIVNDGSEDNTMDIVYKALDLTEIPKYYVDEIPTQKVRAVYRSKNHPEIIAIDKDHGRKFDAINAAINASPTPFFVVLDADTFVDSKGFEALIRPILTSPRTIAVGASVRIINGCTIDFNRISTARFPQEFLPAMQSLEYLRAFYLREGLDAFNGNFLIAGAFSIFPRELIIQAGGFGPTAGEDVEIIVRLHRLMLKTHIPYQIKYLPDPVAWTVAPETVNTLGRQRTRWHLGLLESIWAHKSMCFNPRYRWFGMFGFPFWLFGETLEPVVETLAWVYVITTLAFGILDVPFFLTVMAVSFGYTILYTIFSIFIEEFTFRKYPSLKSLIMLLIANFIENFGYRQLTVFWRLRGFYRFLTNFGTVQNSAKFINELVNRAFLKLPKK
jgi:cellulose synthase/poly-beta-1,6-N-acetylglucosamine synthase-like glycosyltransferase